MNTFSFQNIIDGQAIGVSITGMSIVFSGLLLLSIYIKLLPIILELLSGKSLKGGVVTSTSRPVENEKKADVEAKTDAVSIDEEFNDIASVIGIVLQLEHERISQSENEQITISRNESRASMWGSAGKMRKMPQRRTHA